MVSFWPSTHRIDPPPLNRMLQCKVIVDCIMLPLVDDTGACAAVACGSKAMMGRHDAMMRQAKKMKARSQASEGGSDS